jgi:hypothetical protein
VQLVTSDVLKVYLYFVTIRFSDFGTAVNLKS